jgi:hypothetical protein
MNDAALRAAVDILGRSTAVLLFDSGWMHRRTDAVELINDAWVRQTTTVDLSIPHALKPITRPGTVSQRSTWCRSDCCPGCIRA